MKMRAAIPAYTVYIHRTWNATAEITATIPNTSSTIDKMNIIPIMLQFKETLSLSFSTNEVPALLFLFTGKASKPDLSRIFVMLSLLVPFFIPPPNLHSPAICASQRMLQPRRKKNAP